MKTYLIAVVAFFLSQQAVANDEANDAEHFENNLIEINGMPYIEIEDEYVQDCEEEEDSERSAAFCNELQRQMELENNVYYIPLDLFLRFRNQTE